MSSKYYRVGFYGDLFEDLDNKCASPFCSLLPSYSTLLMKRLISLFFICIKGVHL